MQGLFTRYSCKQTLEQGLNPRLRLLEDKFGHIGVHADAAGDGKIAAGMPVAGRLDDGGYVFGDMIARIQKVGQHGDPGHALCHAGIYDFWQGGRREFEKGAGDRVVFIRGQPFDFFRERRDFTVRFFPAAAVGEYNQRLPGQFSLLLFT